MNFKRLLNRYALAAMVISFVACSDDNDPNPDPDPNGKDNVYVLGVGVTTPTETTNYVVEAEDLMSGTISLEGNGLLQDGYRDYAIGGPNFYSIGGLGVTDVNTLHLNSSDELVTETGLTFEYQNDGFMDVDGNGNTMLGVSSPSSPDVSENIQFYTVDVASNTISKKVGIPMDDIYTTSEDWNFFTGMQVSDGKLYHTFYPVSYTTYDTKNTDKVYVAIYSYPDFELEKVISDERTGPAGAFNTRSGIFRTESGDLYTVSTSSYSNGYSQTTRPAGILKITSGTTEFDSDYFFNTDTAENGGKIAHAIYVGNGKLFAAITSKEPTIDDRWSDANLRLAIVDLNAKTIKLVENAPEFSGNGGRSFAAFLDNGKVYSTIADSSGIVNIYQTDVASASATKGAVVQGTFVGGIAKLK